LSNSILAPNKIKKPRLGDLSGASHLKPFIYTSTISLSIARGERIIKSPPKPQVQCKAIC